MKSAVGELFNNLIVDVERLFRVVVKEMGDGLEFSRTFGGHRCCSQGSDHK